MLLVEGPATLVPGPILESSTLQPGVRGICQENAERPALCQ